MNKKNVYKAFDLNDEQLKKFGKIHRNTYGSSGAFLGMCLNQSAELGEDFELVLKKALDVSIQADITERLLSTKEKEWKREKEEEKKVKEAVVVGETKEVDKILTKVKKIKRSF